METHGLLAEGDWKKIISGEKTVDHFGKDRVRQSLLHGLPAHLRGSIWSTLSSARRLATCFSEQVYLRLMQTSSQEVDATILRDVYRTFPNVDMFRDEGGYGQRGLYNVLRAYSAYDPEIAYCQGMGFIVGLLLTELYSEEDTFWVFVQVMHAYEWRALFLTDTPKLITMVQVLDGEVAKRLPVLYKHFQTEEVTVDVPFTPYVMTIFACGTPREFAVRVMDNFLLDGEEIVFILVLRMLALKETQLLALRGEALYAYLRRSLVLECSSQFPLSTLLCPI